MRDEAKTDAMAVTKESLCHRNTRANPAQSFITAGCRDAISLVEQRGFQMSRAAGPLSDFQTSAQLGVGVIKRVGKQARQEGRTPGAFDELPPTNEVFSGADYVLDVPSKGLPGASDFAFYVTNYVSVTTLSANPYVRQIRSDAVWQFYLTGNVYTNTSILLRTANQ